MKQYQKIAFLGDSVTEGCFELYPTDYGFDTVRRPEDGYVQKTVSLLAAAYGNAPDFRNFGKSGASTFGGMTQVDEAIAYQPDLAVACFGLNNVTQPEERFFAALDELLSRLCAAVPDVIYLTPNRMNTYLHPNLGEYARKLAVATAEAQTSGKFDRMMEEARRIALRHGATVCDGYALWCEMAKSVDVTDKLLVNYINHPTAEMHDKTASLLAKTILTA